MEKIKAWISEHPYLAGALVLGIFLIWLVRRNAANAAAAAAAADSASAGTTVAGPSEALQAAELSAATGLQQTQLAANAQISSQNAAVNMAALQYGSQVQLAQFASQDQLQQTLSAQETTDQQTAASLALGLVQAGQTPVFGGTIGGLQFGENNTGTLIAAQSVNTPTNTQTNTPSSVVVNMATTNNAIAAAQTAQQQAIAGASGLADLQATNPDLLNIPGLITAPGYTPVPIGGNTSFTPSGWLTSCPTNYELVNGACVPPSNPNVAADLAQAAFVGDCATYLGGVCPGPDNPYNRGPNPGLPGLPGGAGLPGLPGGAVTPSEASNLDFQCQQNPSLCSPSNLYGTTPATY